MGNCGDAVIVWNIGIVSSFLLINSLRLTVNDICDSNIFSSKVSEW
jgi:hypothetical protein